MLTNKIASTDSGDQEVAASIGRSTLYGVVARIAQVATRLVTVPIVIAHLGLGGYGIWAILMTAAAYMRFGSVGIKSAFQKYVAEATGNGNFERTNELLSTGTAAMFCLSVVGLIPISLFSQKLAELGGVPPEFLKGAAYSISVLAIIMLLSNVGAAYEAIVIGRTPDRFGQTIRNFLHGCGGRGDRNSFAPRLRLICHGLYYGGFGSRFCWLLLLRFAASSSTS